MSEFVDAPEGWKRPEVASYDEMVCGHLEFCNRTKWCLECGISFADSELTLVAQIEETLPVEVCPNCTVHYTPDPDVGGGKPVCPVCETRKQCEHLMGQFMQVLKGKKDKRPPSKQKRKGRIIIPGRFNGR